MRLIVQRGGQISLLLFGVTLLIWLLGFTVFERTLVSLGLSLAQERWLVGVTLLLPAALGELAGLLGLARARQGRGWAAVGMLLNGLLVALFAATLLLAG